MKRDETLISLTLVVLFIVAIAGIVIMVRPLVPSFPASSNALTGQVYAVGDTIPAEYAPPWDVFDPGAGLFFTVADPDYTGLGPGDTVDVELTIHRPGGFIYNYLLYSDGDDWENDTLGAGYWLTGEVTKTLTYQYEDLVDDNYLLIYTCKYNELALNDSWDCGCKTPLDPACRSYQIQWFPGPTGTTGCTPDDTRPCYTGPTGTQNVGICTNGTQTCQADGTWGSCLGEVLPGTEICDNLLDDDCDTFTDMDDPECIAGCSNDCADGDVGCSANTPWTCGEAGDGDDCLDKVMGTDCTPDTCVNGVCVPTEPPIEGELRVSRYEAVVQLRTPNECSQAMDQSTGPQMTDVAYDQEDKILYVNDHIGIRRYAVNGVQPASEQAIELFRWQCGSCVITPPDFVSEKIRYTADTAGCEGSRGGAVYFAGKNYLWSVLHHLTSHPNSMLVYTDEGGTLRLDSEVASTGGPSKAVSRQGGGIGYIGGGTINGAIAVYFPTGSKKYALMTSNGHQNSMNNFDFDNAWLYDITNPLDMQNLGTLSSHPMLEKTIKSHCYYSSSHNRWYCRLLGSVTPDRLAVIEDGSEHVLVDYQDPTDIVELDRWTPSGSFSYIGAVNGDDAVLDGNTVYVHLKAQNDNQHWENLPEPRFRMTRCWHTSHGNRPCYFGQIWKHELGTDNWEKVMDVPAYKATIYDGKLFLTGKLFDPDNLYTHSPEYHPYQLHVTYNHNIWIYDLEAGEWVHKKEIYTPTRCRGYTRTRTAGAVMKQDNKYYLYTIMKQCHFEGDAPTNIIMGYEIEPCTGGACNAAPTTNLCIPNCEGKTCGAADGCGNYCRQTLGCADGMSCEPLWWENGGYYTQPSCRCGYTNPDGCTPRQTKLVINGETSDHRCTFNPHTCHGVPACSKWIWGTTYPGAFWRNEIEAHAAAGGYAFIDWNGYTCIDNPGT